MTRYLHCCVYSIMYSLLNCECIPVFLGVTSQGLLNGCSRTRHAKMHTTHRPNQQENISTLEYTALYKRKFLASVVTSSLSLTCRRHLHHTTDTTQTASQAPVSRTKNRACATHGWISPPQRKENTRNNDDTHSSTVRPLVSGINTYAQIVPTNARPPKMKPT